MKGNLIKYIVLEQLITENRLEQAKTAYPCLPPALIDYFNEKDPSPTKKYLAWMCKQFWDEGEGVNSGIIEDNTTAWLWLDESNPYAGRGFVLPTCKSVWLDNGQNFNGPLVAHWVKELADIIIEEVVTFHRVVAGLKQKDINTYNYHMLNRTLAPAKLKSMEKQLSKDVNKIYEDDNWLIMSPKTHQASCIYGANTQWCVTTRNNSDYFNRYTRDDFYLIFVINKKENIKWAINTKKVLGTPTEDVEINLPWHREIELSRRGSEARERFPKNGKDHNKYVENVYKRNFDTKTTYWDVHDNPISWDRFIEMSKLPTNLQELLKAVEQKVKINFARKKKTDVAYEINQNPVRLKKGDRVKLLASGHGLYRGDEGVVTSTYMGASGKQTKLTVDDPGLYKIYVATRKPYQGHTDHIKNNTGDLVSVPVHVVAGNYLEKISKKK